MTNIEDQASLPLDDPFRTFDKIDDGWFYTPVGNDALPYEVHVKHEEDGEWSTRVDKDSSTVYGPDYFDTFADAKDDAVAKFWRMMKETEYQDRFDALFKPDPEMPRWTAGDGDKAPGAVILEYDPDITRFRIWHVLGPNIKERSETIRWEDFEGAMQAAVRTYDEVQRDTETTATVTIDVEPSDETEVLLIAYGVPADSLNDPAALRETLLTTFRSSHRLRKALALVMPYAQSRVEDMMETAAEADDGVACGTVPKDHAADANNYAKRGQMRFEAAEAVCADLGIEW